MSAKNSRGPNLLGFLLAPLTPGFLLLFLSMIEMDAREGVWALEMSALVGYPAMVILGLPAHLLLKRTGWTSLGIYAFVGLLIGLAIATALFYSMAAKNFSLMPDPGKSITPSIAVLVLAAFFGAISGIVYWLIGRPDRSPITA
jgi:hypothetical protein